MAIKKQFTSSFKKHLTHVAFFPDEKCYLIKNMSQIVRRTLRNQQSMQDMTYGNASLSFWGEKVSAKIRGL